MRIHVIQHVPFEDEGRIRLWARLRKHTLTRTRTFAGDPFPSQRDFDALVVTGGPMNVYEYDQYAWLLHEKTFILDTIEARHPVLGICLGAQLIADVLGGRVSPNRHREIGWFPVSVMASARRMLLFRSFPPEFTPFHWHGDTFGLPAGAIRLGSSEACANQGFLVGDRVIGLQFHIEYSRRSLHAMIKNAGHEMVAAPFVQEPPAVLAAASHLAMNRAILFALLDAWVARASRP